MMSGQNEMSESAEYKAGRTFGAEWREKQAKPKEITRLRAYSDALGDLPVFIGEPLAPHTHADQVALIVLGDDFSDPSEFWDSIPCDAGAAEDRWFLQGFVDGALK